MTDWTDNHMTTDRKDGQSENYGFTLVINTPPPVYDSGLKPLEVVGELTLNIKDMEDIKIKRDIVELIGQEPVGKKEELFDWLKENRNHEDYMIRCDCVNRSYPNHKAVYDWIMTGEKGKTGNSSIQNTDLWYLREGDFLPEPVSGIFNNRGPGKTGIKLLKEAGNLFPSKEEATIASEKVREFLCSINNPWCL